MTYRECLEYLYTKLPMFERQGPSGIKKDLTNTLALCEILGNPHTKFKTIHIAGTNGKGSVSHMLASILQEAGYKTGLYISPHYKDFRERIRINGKYISKKYITDFVDNIIPAINEIKPSFFEITVALTFKYFADKKIDIAVIETGLGGRLDSTNVINPLLSIITNISYDHQKILGDTLPQIASEKAGIIKDNTPVLIGEYQPNVYFVFTAKAKEKNAPLRLATKYGKVMTHVTTGKYIYRSSANQYIKLDMPYHGPYQEKNINTVIQAIQWMNETADLSISMPKIKLGLKNLDQNVPLIGRFQILGNKPMIIADGAHNLSGLKLLFERVKQLSKGTVHVVFGTVKDKDYQSVIRILPREFKYYFVKAELPRALDDDILLTISNTRKLHGEKYGKVTAGFKAAKSHARSNDIVLVTGSIFVVGEVI